MKTKTDARLMTCVNCGVTRLLSGFTLSEEATLTCPVCFTQFAISAAMKRRGGEQEQRPEEELPEPGAEAAPAPEAPAAEAPPVAGESVEPRVLACVECGAEWLGHKVEPCYECGSKHTLFDDQTVLERIGKTLKQVNSGVDAIQAVAMLLGYKHLKPKLSERAARQQGVCMYCGDNLNPVQQLVSRGRPICGRCVKKIQSRIVKGRPILSPVMTEVSFGPEIDRLLKVNQFGLDTDKEPKNDPDKAGLHSEEQPVEAGWYVVCEKDPGKVLGAAKDVPLKMITLQDGPFESKRLAQEVADKLNAAADRLRTRGNKALTVNAYTFRAKRYGPRPVSEDSLLEDDKATARAAEKKWVGDLGKFNAKLASLLRELGITADIGRVTGDLKDSGALTIKGDVISLDKERARPILMRYVKVSGETQVEADTPVPTPPQKPPSPVPSLPAPPEKVVPPAPPPPPVEEPPIEEPVVELPPEGLPSEQPPEKSVLVVIPAEQPDVEFVLNKYF